MVPMQKAPTAISESAASRTRFVTWVVLLLSFPIVVVQAWASWHYGWGAYWAWGFASVYVAVLALTFLWRFRQGKWKAMRVIEAVVESDAGQPGCPAEEAQAAEFGAPAALGSKSLICNPPANRQ